MPQGTAIEWTDATWSPVTGCTRVSAGCAHCYIERTPPMRMAGRRFARVGNEETTGVQLHPERLDRIPRGPRVFVCSMSDLFHDEVPDTFVAEVFEAMRMHPDRIFQVLTKRPERALDWFCRWHRAFERFASTTWPLPNVWVGVSVENARYTWRADVLREIPAAVRFISAEPLLGSLFQDSSRERAASQSAERGHARLHADGGRGDQAPGLAARSRAPLDLTGIDWCIIGGESGPGARGMDLAWAREAIAVCRAAGVAPFVKQLGSNAYEHLRSDLPHMKFAAEVRDRKGGDISEWPGDLRVREFPLALERVA